MDRKKRRKKRNKHVSYKWRGGGVFGEGEGGILSCISKC